MGSDLKYIYSGINGSDLNLPVEMSVDGSSGAVLSDLLKELQ